jgi:outer membrane biosynthesis protein TonB
MRALVTPPRYPEELKLRNVQGEVLMQFVVDTAAA